MTDTLGEDPSDHLLIGAARRPVDTLKKIRNIPQQHAANVKERVAKRPYSVFAA